MIVLTTSSGIQNCSITPRNANLDKCIFHDEIENTYTEVVIAGFTEEAYYIEIELDFTGSFQLMENRFYMMLIYDIDTNILLKEKVFCTDQPITTFNVNQGQYISNNSANNFIVLNS